MQDWQRNAVEVLKGLRVEVDYPMSRLTTFKIGGPIDLLVQPTNYEELSRVIAFCADRKIPRIILGLGSNLLVRDKGIRGVGIKLAGEFLDYQINGTIVTSGAGKELSDLVKATASHGLSGLEFACGIPGSVGGAVFMNAGAYDGEIAQVLTEVEAINGRGEAIVFLKEQLNLGYRQSLFQTDPDLVITKASFKLNMMNNEKCQAKIADLTCKRESKQPLEMPSAGSVFRRPEGYYVGPLIEEAGLKGFSIGGAQVSPKHAGFIVNTGGATAHDVLSLIAHIQKKIKETKGVDLVAEIRVIGEE